MEYTSVEWPTWHSSISMPKRKRTAIRRNQTNLVQKKKPSNRFIFLPRLKQKLLWFHCKRAWNREKWDAWNKTSTTQFQQNVWLIQWVMRNKVIVNCWRPIIVYFKRASSSSFLHCVMRNRTSENVHYKRVVLVIAFALSFWDSDERGLQRTLHTKHRLISFRKWRKLQVTQLIWW